MLAGYTGKYGRFEIERKFVLKLFPAGFSDEFQDLHDTYLPHSTLRLRIIRSPKGEVTGRNLTQKSKPPGSQDSVSIMTSLYLSEDDLSALGSLNGAVIEKRRYFVETESNRISIDVFKGLFHGLILAEVEFRSEQERDAYSPPEEWAEVTGNRDYSCGFLAFHPESFATLPLESDIRP
jgi:CYTH domain-containing protein